MLGFWLWFKVSIRFFSLIVMDYKPDFTYFDVDHIAHGLHTMLIAFLYC